MAYGYPPLLFPYLPRVAYPVIRRGEFKPKATVPYGRESLALLLKEKESCVFGWLALLL